MGSGNSHLYKGTQGTRPKSFTPGLGTGPNAGSSGDIGTGGVGGEFTHGGYSEVFKPGEMVVLIKEFHNMPIGTIGEILIQTDKTHYQIRFYDTEYHTIGDFITPRSYFRFLN